MDSFVLILLVVLLCSSVSQAQSMMYLVANNLCLTLSSDQQTVQMNTCGMYPYQLWDISSGERVSLSGYCLDAFPGINGGLQLKPCAYSLSQTWWFGPDGHITSKAQPSGCLSSSGTMGSLLFLRQCGPSSPAFQTSQVVPTQNLLPTQGLPAMTQQYQGLPSLQQQQQQPQYPQYPQQYSQPYVPPLQPQYPVQYLPMQPPQQFQPPSLQQAPFVLPMQQQQPFSQVPPIQNQQQPFSQVPPIQNQQPPVVQQAVQQQQQPSPPVQMSQQIQQAAQVGDVSKDHYLCVCIVDANAENCNQAVRAACTVGHLDSKNCRQSFSSGDHDLIADEILKVIDNGVKCSTFDKNKLLSEAQQRRAIDLPKAAFKGSSEGTPTAEDHYLCVCLDSSNSDKCIAAVRAACIVGHIPSGDCAASLSKNDHDGATDHILKLIDSGASCSQRLQKNKSPDCPNPPCYKAIDNPGFFSRMIGRKPNTVGTDEKDLCTCLDDQDSAACGQAILKACDAGRIPAEDCAVAKKSKYLGGVTRNALKLIDHGADCPAHRSMTFTNHGCHCLQSWTEDGKKFSFPNNCADPGGKKGYAWCKTFNTEHCAGVEGSIEWDRCDNPKFPIRRDPTIVDGANSDSFESDHYLCVCLAATSTDEVCVAAVKAGCETGHLPSAACKDSFESSDHQAVSDMVVQVLKGGDRCKETLSSDRSSTIQLKPGDTECPDGYFGFPNCKKKVECDKACSHGATCDFSVGACQCMPNFIGPTCSECAEGTSGRNCLPDGEDGGWTLGQGLVYLFLFAGLAYAGFTAYKKWGGDARSIIYSKLPQRDTPEYVGEGIPTHVEDQISMSSDLGGDVEEQIPPPKRIPPPQEHTGLAV